MTMILAELPDSVTPYMLGIFLMIGLQLSTFYFAWRKDQRATDNVRKADLTDLRDDLMAEIDDVADDLKSFKISQDRKMEDTRVEAARTHKEIHDRITESATNLSALMAGQEMLSQQLTAVANKLDTHLIK